MKKQSLCVAGVALLALAAGRPAAADDNFLQPYGHLFGARTILASPNDPRAKDALQGQETTKENPRARWVLGLMGGSQNLRGVVDREFYGGGVGYANVSDPDHPWELALSGFANRFDFGAGPRRNEPEFQASGKYVLWTPANVQVPVVSGYARFANVANIGHRTDVGLAADQKLSRDAYVTANVGYGHLNPVGPGVPSQEDFVAGLGVTWRASRKLSLSVDYVFDNDIDGEDVWSASALWAFDRHTSMRFGGGKHDMFFGALQFKLDR